MNTEKNYKSYIFSNSRISNRTEKLRVADTIGENIGDKIIM